MQLTNEKDTESRELILDSIYSLKGNINIIVKRFYEFLLNTEFGSLLKIHFDKEDQIEETTKTISILFNNIENLTEIENRLIYQLENRYNIFTVKTSHFNSVLDSFLLTIREFLSSKSANLNQRIVTLWYELSYEIMNNVSLKYWKEFVIKE